MSYGGKEAAGRHDNTHSPVALWQLDESLTDVSGNGLNLTVESGTERYTELVPGLRGFFFDGDTGLWRSAATAALQISGPMTVEFVGVFTNFVVDKPFVSHGASGETIANNYLYYFGSVGTGFGMRSYWEEAAGANVEYTTPHMFPLGTPCHLALRRGASNATSFFVNGVQIGTTSGVLTSPVDGTSGRFRMGRDDLGASLFGAMASVKIVASALTADQIKAEYNRTLGPLLGFRT